MVRLEGPGRKFERVVFVDFNSTMVRLEVFVDNP